MFFGNNSQVSVQPATVISPSVFGKTKVGPSCRFSYVFVRLGEFYNFSIRMLKLVEVQFKKRESGVFFGEAMDAF